jgi:hypothetical protein
MHVARDDVPSGEDARHAAAQKASGAEKIVAQNAQPQFDILL